MSTLTAHPRGGGSDRQQERVLTEVVLSAGTRWVATALSHDVVAVAWAVRTGGGARLP